MRHRKKSEKFSRPRAQRKALVKALLRSVLINERIVTTTSKAKYLRGEVDRLITWAKKRSLANRRLAYKVLGDHAMVKRLFEIIGPRFKTINGGYSRVLRVGTRKGDGAPLSIFELTKIEKKLKVLKGKKEKAKVTEISEEKDASKKEKKPKKGILSGVKKALKSKKEAS